MDIQIRKNYSQGDVTIAFGTVISNVEYNLKLKSCGCSMYKSYSFTYQNLFWQTPEEIEFFITEIHRH